MQLLIIDIVHGRELLAKANGTIIMKHGAMSQHWQYNYAFVHCSFWVGAMKAIGIVSFMSYLIKTRVFFISSIPLTVALSRFKAVVKDAFKNVEFWEFTIMKTHKIE